LQRRGDIVQLPSPLLERSLDSFVPSRAIGN
jgi:hypothetical protein